MTSETVCTARLRDEGKGTFVYSEGDGASMSKNVGGPTKYEGKLRHIKVNSGQVRAPVATATSNPQLHPR